MVTVSKYRISSRQRGRNRLVTLSVEQKLVALQRLLESRRHKAVARSRELEDSEMDPEE